MGFVRILALSIMCSLCASHANAQQADFYAGKTIKIIVGYAPGSSYDGYARLIAQNAGRYIKGNPISLSKICPAPALSQR